jgi:hypothetical protein
MENKKCLALIQLYKSKQILWNSKSANCHNKSIREDASINSHTRLPRFDTGHEHSKQTNEFAAHEQMRGSHAQSISSLKEIVSP